MRFATPYAPVGGGFSAAHPVQLPLSRACVGLALPRYAACKEGHFEVVAALLQAEGILVDKATLRQGSTPLIAATHAGHVEIIQVRRPRSRSPSLPSPLP